MNHRWPLEVEVVAQKAVQQAHPVSGRGDRYRANRRDATVWIPNAMHRGLAAGGIGTPDDGLKHEAGFIHKDEVGFPCRCGFQDAGERFPNPPLYRGVVSVLVMMHWPLACPIQLVLQEPANMTGMIMNPKMYLDDLGNSLCRPKVIGPTMRRRAFCQQLFQRPVVLVCKALGSTWRRGGE